MRTLLQIGEVAQLLGVTTKTLRHYHKVGLIQEPERTSTGYRLYTPQDLVCLKRIRHLQSLGFSLKQIKTILGEPPQEHTLREILQSLDAELANQVRVLEERRARIQGLLEEETGRPIDQPAPPPSFVLAKELLGEKISGLSPEVLALEERLWEPIDNFAWPAEYSKYLHSLVQYFSSNPAFYEQLLAFGEKMALLTALPEDAPEVEQLIEASLQDNDLQAFIEQITRLSQPVPHMESPFADTLEDLLATNFSPAQKRFFAEISSKHSSIKPTI